MVKLLSVLFVFIFSISAFSTIWQVGSTRTYKYPFHVNTLVSDGDTVDIDAEDYPAISDITFTANNLLIRGVGGRPHITSLSVVVKGIFVIEGQDCVIENIQFSNAKVNPQVPDIHNGSGIRASGVRIVVRNCLFSNNEDGLHAAGATIPGEGGKCVAFGCEMYGGGFSNGKSHNIYITANADSFAFVNSYSHAARIGHCLKTRARVNQILYSRIMDEDTGRSSYVLNIPVGGKAIVKGCILEQGALTENHGYFMRYGEEGYNNPAPHELYVVNNTFINNHSGGYFIGIASGVDTALLMNNIFIGPGNITDGSPVQITNLKLDRSDSTQFMDYGNFDMRLKVGAAAIDAGTMPLIHPAGLDSLVAAFHYIDTGMNEVRIVEGSAIDIGAFEFGAGSYANDDLYNPVHSDAAIMEMMPNPFNPATKVRYILRRNSKIQLTIHDATGKLIKTLVSDYRDAGVHNQEWHADGIASGTYLIRLKTDRGFLTKRAIFLK